MSTELTVFREPSESERRLLARAGSVAEGLDPSWLEGVRVRSMNDGRMGSLAIAVPGKVGSGRQFGRRVAEFQFTDADGVEVIVSLNVDADGMPLELDVWKTDFSPLVRVPPL